MPLLLPKSLVVETLTQEIETLFHFDYLHFQPHIPFTWA